MENSACKTLLIDTAWQSGRLSGQDLITKLSQLSELAKFMETHMATARSDETSLERQAKTNSQGLFVFGSLPIGHYTLRIERSGFATFEMHNIVLTVAESLAVNAQMKLGDTAETVNVIGTGELSLETESSQRGQIINREEIRALPLVSRQYSQLVLLTTGTMQSQAGISNGNLAREGAFNVDGLRSIFNNSCSMVWITTRMALPTRAFPIRLFNHLQTL